MTSKPAPTDPPAADNVPDGRPTSEGEVRGPHTGYVALLGRPNAGKSTLLNRLVGAHLSIVTAKAQTTWQRVTGVLTTGTDQLIFLDTPGVLEARDLLQRAMLGAALEALAEADVVLVVVDASRPPGARDGERLLTVLDDARLLPDPGASGPNGRSRRRELEHEHEGDRAAAPRRRTTPLHVALNKVDAAAPEAVSAWQAWLDEHVGKQGMPISALEGQGTDALLAAVRDDLPAGPFLYPEDDIASEPVRFFVAELVRETIFEQFRQEIPYSVFCQVEAFRETQDPIYIQVNVFVERASQKGMIIGKKGQAIRRLGEASREKIETFLGQSVYLDLWVKPLQAWRKNRAHLSQLGFRLPPENEAESR